MLTSLTAGVSNRLTYLFGGLATQLLAYLNAINACLRRPGYELVLKAADYTLLPADNGKTFLATAAAAFTLPTAADGLHFYIGQTADANMSVVGSNNIIVDGDAEASSVAFSTASHKIGAYCLVCAVEVAEDTYKWAFFKLCANAHTIT